MEIPIRFSDLPIRSDDLNKALGYRRSVPQGEAAAIIASILHEAAQVCRPRLGMRIVEGEARDGLLRMADITFHPGTIILSRLRRGRRFAVILGSVGPEMDEWIKSRQANDDIMATYVADAIGSIVAESIIEYAKNYLRRKCQDTDCQISNSYSPGYCGWDVSEQHALFRLLPPGLCGVELLSSSLMAPIKSVSAVVAIGPEVTYDSYQCAICRKHDCYKRR